MGIAYLTFTVLLGLILIFMCTKRGLPKLWAMLVFILPITAPLILFKSKRTVTLLPVIVVLAGFIFAGSLEFYLFSKHREENKYSHLPPIVREMIRLNESVVNSTIKIYEGSKKLDSLGMVQSRLSDIRTTLELIETMRGMLTENKNNIDQFISYIDRHKAFIHRQNLYWAAWISKFYNDPCISQHASFQKMYFNAFEDLLMYMDKNYDKIMQVKSSQHLANYNAYYLRYRGIADRYNRISKKRIKCHENFIALHPEVKPFLPGSHHLSPFKFWDKFSF